MSGRITMTVDGTLVSDADLARMQAEEELHAQWQRRTARVVAASASDVEDCRLLLSILGLNDEIVAQARAERPRAAATRSAKARTGKARAAAKTHSTTRTAKTRTSAGTATAERNTQKARKPRAHAAA